MKDIRHEVWRKVFLKAYNNYLENPDDFNCNILFQTAYACSLDMDQVFIRTHGSNFYVPCRLLIL